MAQSVSALPQSSFPLANVLKSTFEIQQYEKLLKLRDDVVAGIHPRIKLIPSAPTNGIVNQVVGNNVEQANGTTTNSLADSNGLPGLQTIPTTFHEIDSTPRSKTRLERQRIERDIVESFKKDKDVAGRRGYEQDILPDFDVSEVFFQAQENAKPLIQRINRQAANSVSGDEETFYSSGAATEESEEHNSKKATTKPCKFFFEDGTCKKGDRCNFSHDLAFKQQLQKNAHMSNKGLPRPGFTAQGGRIRESPTYDNAEDGELADEAPYSPSMNIAVEDLSESQRIDQMSHTQGASNYTPPNSFRTDNRSQGKYPQRGKDTQIVRNHITSPIAPQPSRVSPLAVAKVSRIDKGRSDYTRAAGQYPDTGSQQSSRSRKRRRDADPSDLTRNVAPRTTMASPEPYIKSEPVSPPPLSSIPQQIRRQSGQVNHSPRYDDRSRRESVSDHNNRIAQPAALTPNGHRRVISGPGPAPDPRRQQDLRRIVSTRNLDRPTSPGYETGPRPNTSSQFIRPREELVPVSYRASVQPQRQTYLVEERAMSPVVRYARRPEESELIPMPPPTGRVVVDEYGNRYLETTVSDRRGLPVSEPRYVEEIRPRPEQIESIRASVRPESRYYEPTKAYNPESLAAARASVRPEPRYVQERLYQPAELPRASIPAESRYHERRVPQAEPANLSRASIRPEARAEAIFINPTFEQINMSGRPGERDDIRRAHREPEFSFRATTPKPQQQAVEYRASVQPTARPNYKPESGYQLQQDYHQPINPRTLVRRAEEYGRMAENVSRMSAKPVENLGRASVRPVEYVERGYRQSIDPERFHYQEARRETGGYVLAPQDSYGRQEFIDPPPSARPTYRYVSSAKELPQERGYDGHVYLD